MDFAFIAFPLTHIPDPGIFGRSESFLEAFYKTLYTTDISNHFLNCTVQLKVNAVTDTYNIRWLTPYKEPASSDLGGECSMCLARAKRRS